MEHVYMGAEAIEGAPMTTQQVRVDGVDIAYTDTSVIGQPSRATKEKGLGALNQLGAADGQRGVVPI